MSLWTKDISPRWDSTAGSLAPRVSCTHPWSWSERESMCSMTLQREDNWNSHWASSSPLLQGNLWLRCTVLFQCSYYTAPFQLLNIYIIPSTARHFTFISNPHNQAIKVSLPPVYSCKKTQKRALLKTIKLESSHLHEFTSLHLPTILTGQLLSRAFQTAGHNQSWNKPSGVYSFY